MINNEYFRSNARIECERYIDETLLGDCTAGNMEPAFYKSLGIAEREYKFSEYNENSRIGRNIDVLFRRTEANLTLSERIRRVKQHYPQLEKHIDFYIAMEVKELAVYLASVLYQAQYKQQCIEKNICEVAVPKRIAQLYLDQYQTLVVDQLEHFGSATKEKVQETIASFESSAILDLDFNWNIIHRKYKDWMDKCQKSIHQESTSADDKQLGKENHLN